MPHIPAAATIPVSLRPPFVATHPTDPDLPKPPLPTRPGETPDPDVLPDPLDPDPTPSPAPSPQPDPDPADIPVQDPQLPQPGEIVPPIHSGDTQARPLRGAPAPLLP